MRFLVTAGSTREMIDRVRDWGNVFTGNTGFDIARALSTLGEVDLATSNAQHLGELAGGAIAGRAGAGDVGAAAAGAIHGHRFTTHAELKQLLARLMASVAYDGVFMTAAVADYRPVRVYAVVMTEPDALNPSRERWVVQDVQAAKVKSTHSAIAVLAEPTEKLVDLFRSVWGHKGLLVKFKLEVGVSVEQLIAIGQASRQSSNADYLVANTLEMVGGPQAGAYLLDDAGAQWVPRADLPERMVRLIGPRGI